MKIEDFPIQTLHFPDDYEGKVIASLIRSPKNSAGRPSVLYLHGLSDYFFQVHVAEAFHNQGYNFYALDLRKHGRSLLPHQHPNYCRSITEYFPEIDESLDIIDAESNAEIILLGHSTGGLTAASYLNENKQQQQVQKLILNSPFLQFNMKAWQRFLLLPASVIISKIAPYFSIKKPFSGVYGSSLFHNKNGEWDYNTDWKPLDGFPAYLAWAAAMYKAQKKLHTSADIHIPILILHSAHSTRSKIWKPRVMQSDMVLNVKHIKKYGKRLGHNVNFAEVEGAMHDVFLSPEESRQQAFDKMFSWLNNA